MIFGLIHGGAHSSWCWTYLIPELRARGHDALTVDLPIEDADATLADYTDAAAAAFAGHDQLVVVGHSLGGSTALTTAERLEAAGTILLCPAIVFASSPGAPEPMLTMAPDSTTVEDGRMIMTADSATYWFYSDCSSELAAEAARNIRPQGVAGTAGPAAPAPLTMPSVLVRAEDDRCVGAEWQTWAARTLTGRDPVVIPGSHSPFLSRPAALADVFDTFAGSLGS